MERDTGRDEEQDEDKQGRTEGKEGGPEPTCAEEETNELGTGSVGRGSSFGDDDKDDEKEEEDNGLNLLESNARGV